MAVLSECTRVEELCINRAVNSVDKANNLCWLRFLFTRMCFRKWRIKTDFLGACHLQRWLLLINVAKDLWRPLLKQLTSKALSLCKDNYLYDLCVCENLYSRLPLPITFIMLLSKNPWVWCLFLSSWILSWLTYRSDNYIEHIDIV